MNVFIFLYQYIMRESKGNRIGGSERGIIWKWWFYWICRWHQGFVGKSNHCINIGFVVSRKKNCERPAELCKESYGFSCMGSQHTHKGPGNWRLGMLHSKIKQRLWLWLAVHNRAYRFATWKLRVSRNACHFVAWIKGIFARGLISFFNCCVLSKICQNNFKSKT